MTRTRRDGKSANDRPQGSEDQSRAAPVAATKKPPTGPGARKRLAPRDSGPPGEPEDAGAEFLREAEEQDDAHSSAELAPHRRGRAARAKSPR
jgi:hypothetical protein